MTTHGQPALDGKGYGTHGGARALAGANPPAPVDGCNHKGWPVADVDGRCFRCRPRGMFGVPRGTSPPVNRNRGGRR